MADLAPQHNGPSSVSINQSEKSDDTASLEKADKDSNSKTFLNNVYLQKTPYKIEGKHVEQIDEQAFQPTLFIDAIKEFESGQVYSVITKNDDGTFSVLDKNVEKTFAEKVAAQALGQRSHENIEDGYLIYIVTQDVIFNEEISTITYFKDITFGVLYE